jgi:hypothetical protein
LECRGVYPRPGGKSTAFNSYLDNLCPIKRIVRLKEIEGTLFPFCELPDEPVLVRLEFEIVQILQPEMVVNFLAKTANDLIGGQ